MTETMQSEDLRKKPFDFIRGANIAQFFYLIRQEHPQTIALVLSYLEPNKASIILQNLPHEIQGDIIRRIACMGITNPVIIKKIESVLEKKLSMVSGEDYFAAGGVKSAIDILNLVDRFSEKIVIETLEDNDPELAEELKSRMFVFENIVTLNDRAIQRVMREVDSQELAKALKNMNAEVQNKIFNNMSKRAALMLKEDMDYMGPVRLIEVEEAQQKIISIIRHLEDTGEIVVPRSRDDEIVDTRVLDDKIETEEHEKPVNGWDKILSLKNNEIERLLTKVNRKTLATALALPCPDIFNKLTSSMGIFKRNKLKQTIRKLKGLSVNDVVNAQNEIITIINNLSSYEDDDLNLD